MHFRDDIPIIQFTEFSFSLNIELQVFLVLKPNFLVPFLFEWIDIWKACWQIHVDVSPCVTKIRFKAQ